MNSSTESSIQTDGYAETLDRNRVRALPSQARSKERVDLILRCTVEIICEVGVNGAKTSEIARRAGISLASLYRYFPNKTAIVATLADRYFQELRNYLSSFLENFDLQQIGNLIDELSDFYRNKPGFVEILRGIGSMPELKEQQEQDRKMAAEAIQKAVTNLYPHLAGPDITMACWMISDAVVHMLQQSQQMPPEQVEYMLKELKLMVGCYAMARLGGVTKVDVPQVPLSQAGSVDNALA